ncbi:MAG: MotA/TolQ/ExbB proton channel family protein [Gammaproteobacteria bacterium]|jgi:biopolymer transport protein TolQ|nr:protein TolQ [Gammaproteobacteria bacterium]MEC7167298.1 MotA/TolQ/ExbB proton channel family protein [Pseudomonadota bacterium]GIR08830.1 MAG: protein TolQ [Gammaproteobacteria bacterium]|tara:strand:- start:253 stop:900 length:648 start_codon:yes stop_codon:yes gene_type:complete
MNFEGLELILQASLPVQIILAILCLASLLSWVLIFEKYFSLTRSVKSSHEIEDRFWEGEKLSDLYTDLKEKELAELETSELVLVTIYDSYNNKKNADSIDSTERLVRVVINREEERLSKNLSLLATISSSAPYIGLLGTVIGIINAFQGLSTTAQLTLSSVAPGISEALVATAVGLLAAIPALIGFNQFSKQLDNLLNGSLAFAEELIIQIAKDK